MEYVIDACKVMSGWMRPYLLMIATAMVGTVLFIYGNDINRVIKQQLKDVNFVIRVLVFVLVCSFGYGSITVLMSTMLAKILGELSKLSLAPVVIGIFLIIGVLAEQKNQI